MPDKAQRQWKNRAYTYLLRCADGTLYCGWTKDLTARLAAHNNGTGAKYTSGRGPVTLVYSEMSDTQGEAMRREAAIKKLSRAEKEALVLMQTEDEMLTVYDAEQRPCGERPRSLVHAQGLFHFVCHLWVCGIWDGVPGVWLQQRQSDRPLYPGCFDLTATGHIDPGESPAAAALREAREETGLFLDRQALIPVAPCRQRYLRTDGGFDEELAWPFLTRIDRLPPFAPGDEVAGMAFAALTDFNQAHQQEISLPVRRPDGTKITVPRNRLCCLHQEEWERTKILLEQMDFC